MANRRPGFGVRRRQEISFGRTASDRRVRLATPRARSMRRVFRHAIRSCVSTRSGSSVVVIAQNGFSTAGKLGETLSGTYVLAQLLLIPEGVVPSPPARASPEQRHGRAWQGPAMGATYTFAPATDRRGCSSLRYCVEVAAQRGSLGRPTRFDAWAGHYALGWTVVPSAMKPRLVIEINNPRANRDPIDGRRQTFDQLYPTNHTKSLSPINGLCKHARRDGVDHALSGREAEAEPDSHRCSCRRPLTPLFGASTLKVLERKATAGLVGHRARLHRPLYSFSKEF